MDPYEDIFAEAAAKPAPARSKFQPKARPGPKGGPKPPALPAKEKRVALIPSENVSSVDNSLNAPPNLSSSPFSAEEPKELGKGEKAEQFKDLGLEPENVELVAHERDRDVAAMPESTVGDPLGFGDDNLDELLRMPNEPVGRAVGEFQPEPKVRQSNEVCPLDSAASHPGVANEGLAGNGDGHSSFSKSAEANEDVLSHVESLEDLLTGSLNNQGNAVSSHSMDINLEKDSGLPIHHSPDSSNVMEAEVFPGLEAVEHFPEITRSSRGKFIPKPKSEIGAKVPDSRTSEAIYADNDHQRDPLINFENEYVDGGSLPEEIFQYSSIGVEESNIQEPISQPPNDATLDDHLGPCGFNSSILEDSEHENLSWKRERSSADNIDTDAGRSSRKLRKHEATAHIMDESEGDDQDDESFFPEPNSSMNGENEDGESEDLGTLDKRKGSSKSKVSIKEDGKPSRKRKGAEEAAGVEQSKDKPKKKFSHSTRRSRRCVDKVLLQTPEEEIDYRRLKIQDLILLAEHKEREAKRSAKLSKKPSNSESVEKASDGDEARNREGSLPPEAETSSAQPSESVEPSEVLFNYQSFTDWTPKTRWSKQDTELFYEGIRQFGTDLSMIKELFPSRTRPQVKLKFKKEERQNPMRLSDALASRSKDHSHFELVIERLQTAAQAEKESQPENSEAMTVEDGPEDSNAETTGVDEAAKPEKAEEGGSGDTEDNNAEVHSSMKSNENRVEQEEEEVNDDDDFFSSYKSEL